MKKILYRTVLGTLLILPVLILVLKVELFDYSLERTLSKTSYQVKFNYRFAQNADSALLRFFLPTSSERQTIRSEANRVNGFELLIQPTANGRLATCNGHADPNELLMYSFEFLGYAQRFALDTLLQIPSELSPDIEQLAFNKQWPEQAIPTVDGDRVAPILRTFFDSARVTPDRAVLRFVEWTRSQGMAARFASGLNLSGAEHEQRTWAEVHIKDTWVPFDPSRGYFASIPAGYLKLYTGHQPVQAYHANLGLEQWVEVKQRSTINPDLLAALPSLPYNGFSVWKAFERAGIPLDILKVILLLPLGALIVVLFRNVVGVSTFGVFLPALIAMASRETGFMYGSMAFLLVIGVVSLIHYPLEKLGILSVPKITIMLVTVVGVFILVSLLGVSAGMPSLAYIALFPIVVVTISAERFANTVIQEDLITALKLTLQTLVVAGVAFTVMSSSTVESLFLTFPELFLVIIGLNLILGRWVGIRLTELFRFHWIIR